MIALEPFDLSETNSAFDINMSVCPFMLNFATTNYEKKNLFKIFVEMGFKTFITLISIRLNHYGKNKGKVKSEIYFGKKNAKKKKWQKLF